MCLSVCVSRDGRIVFTSASVCVCVHNGHKCGMCAAAVSAMGSAGGAPGCGPCALLYYQPIHKRFSASLLMLLFCILLVIFVECFLKF